MSAGFKDHFSGHAGDYAAHRPRYPERLFEWLSHVVPGHDLAWDAATGNGQAAVSLARHFDRVIATDASPEQVALARPHERIEYGVSPAEASALDDESCDLITCAQALHWFDIPRFIGEVGRVLRPGGVFAAWGYGYFSPDPDVEPEVMRFREIVASHWPPERRLIDEGYSSIVLPFEGISSPSFGMTAEWDAQQVVAYLYTWSATQRYLRSADPAVLEEAAGAILEAWGESRRVVRWPLNLRCSRKSRE